MALHYNPLTDGEIEEMNQESSMKSDGRIVDDGEPAIPTNQQRRNEVIQTISNVPFLTTKLIHLMDLYLLYWIIHFPTFPEIFYDGLNQETFHIVKCCHSVKYFAMWNDFHIF